MDAYDASPDRYLQALNAYLASRQEVALRLLGEVDKEDVEKHEHAQEEALRDSALAALVRRDYEAAHAITATLANCSARRRRVDELRSMMRLEVDRINSARVVLEQRQQILEQTPPSIQDPLLDSVGESLRKRHDVALRLVAAIDVQLASADASSADTVALEKRRARLMVEIDALLAATQAHEHMEALLDTANEVLGDGTPDSGAYLRRTLAFLDARATIILRIMSFIDAQLETSVSSPTGVVAEAKQAHARSAREHLIQRRAALVRELDGINAQTTEQKRGEAELKAWGLHAHAASGDPYHAKVKQYLQTRSETSLQLLAFIDSRLDAVDTDELQPLSARREELRREADAALEELERQEQGQALLSALGVA